MLNLIKNFLKLLTQKPHLHDKLNKNEVVKIIFNRRSCRLFSDSEIKDEDFDLILEAGRFSPSTANLQTWSFITFTRNEWLEVFNRPLPFNGSRAIVIAADIHRLKPLLPEFSQTPFVSYSFAIFNAGLAAMNMNITAECLGIQSIMLSDTGTTGLLDFSYLKKHLSLPDGVIPITTLVLGIAREIPRISPPRLDRDAIVMKKYYRSCAEEYLHEWFEQMKIGFKLLYPFSDLSTKITYYEDRMKKANKELEELFLINRKNG